MSEAMAIVDAACRAGVDVRLTGGLAIRRHCIDLDFMDREYSDVDLVGLSEQHDELVGVMDGLGYVENLFVGQTTTGPSSSSCAVRRCARPAALAAAEAGADAPAAAPAPGAAGSPRAADETRAAARSLVHHVDVFLDVMRMDHDIDIRTRLDVDEYAISPVDTLIAKAQIGRINQKDVHDIIALFKDLPLREVDDDLSIFVPHIAEVCADDWGPTRTSPRTCAWSSTGSGTTASEGRDGARPRARDRRPRGDRGRGEDAPLAVRARVGTRRAWRNEVESIDETPVDVAPQ